MSQSVESGQHALVLSLLERAAFLAHDGRIPEARGLYHRAMEHDNHGVARNEFGRFLVQIGEYGEALEQFSALIEDARRLDDEGLRRTACHNLAVVYRELGEFQAAAVWQQQAGIGAFSVEDSLQGEMTDDEIRFASDFSGRANDALVAGDDSLAERLLWRSLALEIRAGSFAGQANDWGSLGLIAARKGNFEDAVNYLSRAYELHWQAQDWRGIGNDLLNLGNVCFAYGDWVRARRLFECALGRFEQVGHWRLAHRARHLIEEVGRITDVGRNDPLLN